MLSAREKRITKTSRLVVSAYHLPSVGLEHKVVVDVVPRRAIVSVKALRRAVLRSNGSLLEALEEDAKGSAAALTLAMIMLWSTWFICAV